MLERLKSLTENPYLRFVAANGIFVILLMYAVKKDFEPIYAIPLLLMGLVIAIQNFRNIWYLALFCVPLSLDLSDLLPGAGITFPTDIFASGLMLLTVFKFLQDRKIEFPFFRHPIFWAILAFFIWQWMTSITSTIPLVSVKANLVLTWTIAAFYGLSVMIFLQNRKTIFYFFGLLGMGFCIALGGIFLKYIAMGLNPFGLRFNPTPFFNDHTVFGAWTAMMAPIFILIAWKGDLSKQLRIGAAVMAGALLVGLFFSYSRGGWGSLVLSMGAVLLVINRKMVKKLLLPVAIIVVIASGWLYFNSTSGAKRNDAVSRKGLAQHVASITNFTTDYSNKERINRWNSAIEMWKAKPWFGYGPGTYERQYSGFQRTKYQTPVSVNHGEMGNAHNDILLALSESGWIGAVTIVILFMVPLWRGLRGYLKSEERNIQLLYLGSFAGLLAYIIHSLVNNFLDHDNVAVAFFGMCAVITALDIFRKSQYFVSK